MIVNESADEVTVTMPIIPGFK